MHVVGSTEHALRLPASTPHDTCSDYAVVSCNVPMHMVIRQWCIKAACTAVPPREAAGSVSGIEGTGTTRRSGLDASCVWPQYPPTLTVGASRLQSGCGRNCIPAAAEPLHEAHTHAYTRHTVGPITCPPRNTFRPFEFFRVPLGGGRMALHRHPLLRLSTGPTPLVLRREYPTDADQYELKEECGRGVSATVRCLLWALACQLLLSSAACRFPVHRTWGCACRGERMISLRSVHRVEQCLCAVQDTQSVCVISVH